MATQGRQKPQGWLERQGASLSQKARDEFETSPAGRRLTPRLFLRKDDWHEEEVDQRKNGQRSELTHQ
jgi:hypothetical protein